MLERLIKVVDPDAPPKANLETRIERLRPRMTQPLGELLDVVRVTGNGALHVEDQPGELVVMALHDEEGPELLELLLQAANDLVEELITRPSTTSGLWAKAPRNDPGPPPAVARTAGGPVNGSEAWVPLADKSEAAAGLAARSMTALAARPAVASEMVDGIAAELPAVLNLEPAEQLLAAA